MKCPSFGTYKLIESGGSPDYTVWITMLVWVFAVRVQIIHEVFRKLLRWTDILFGSSHKMQIELMMMSVRDESTYQNRISENHKDKIRHIQTDRDGPRLQSGDHKKWTLLGKHVSPVMSISPGRFLEKKKYGNSNVRSVLSGNLTLYILLIPFCVK